MHFLRSTLALICIVSGPIGAFGHPWGGLVVDDAGTIYFTFVCPFISDDHHACVWRIDQEGDIASALRSDVSPSDIVLARSPERVIYGAERSGSEPAMRARLWEYDGNEWQPFIPSTSNPDLFHIQAYAVDDDGALVFARDDRLFQRTPEGEVTPIGVAGSLGRVDAMAWGPNGGLYIIDKGTLRILSATGSLRTLASGLKLEDPPNLPFSGANILFDIAVDELGNAFVAYYGNRSVLKVSPAGEVSTFLQATSPWSPHGVDVFNGDVYVLESTVGGGVWWKPWERPLIVPRVRRAGPDGQVETIFEYDPDS